MNSNDVQDVSFGFFDAIQETSVRNEMHRILHGPKNVSPTAPEFPWDETGPVTFDDDTPYGNSNDRPIHVADIQFGDVDPNDLRGDPDSIFPAHSGYRLNSLPDGHACSGEQHALYAKTYERRNKKKRRPLDYEDEANKTGGFSRTEAQVSHHGGHDQAVTGGYNTHTSQPATNMVNNIQVNESGQNMTLSNQLYSSGIRTTSVANVPPKTAVVSVSSLNTQHGSQSVPESEQNASTTKPEKPQRPSFPLDRPQQSPYDVTVQKTNATPSATQQLSASVPLRPSRIDVTFGSVTPPPYPSGDVNVAVNMPPSSHLAHTSSSVAVEFGATPVNSTAGVEPTAVARDSTEPAEDDSTAEPQQNTLPVAGDTNIPAVAPAPSPPSSSEASADITAPSGGEPAQAKPKVSSWAGLFKGVSPPASSSGVVAYVSPANPKSQSAPDTAAQSKLSPDPAKQTETESKEPAIVPVSEDKNVKQLGDILLNYRINHRSVSLQPRGLVNKGNWCYVNATLQALLACPPFYHLVKSLPAYPALQRGPSSTPVTDCVAEFINEFNVMNVKSFEKATSGGKTQTVDLQPGVTFEPSNIYKMLQKINYSGAFKHGRQEDAEEFVSIVLNSLHEEMHAALDLVTQNGSKQKESESDGAAGELLTANGDCHGTTYSDGEDAEDDDSQWEQVGPRNKSCVTRTASFPESPISHIFGGMIRSAFHQHGSKESATLQPFFTLQLDIQSEKMWTLNDVLNQLVNKEQVQGYTCSKTKMEVEASRRITLECLPPVLILHLKCFVYDKSGGSQKVIKKIDYDINLDISKELLSPNKRSAYSADQRKYKLFAVVNHHGRHAVGGHYTTDVFHPGLNGWIRTDDGQVRVVSPAQVVKFSPPKVPYLLYYRRLDLCDNSSPAKSSV